MNPNRQKLLQLVSDGILKAEEALELLNTIENRDKGKKLVLEIKSSFQESPLLKIKLTAKKIEKIKRLMDELVDIDFSMNFSAGKFELDFKKLNWDQIIKLTANQETESIYYFETEGKPEEKISLEIKMQR